MQLHFAQKYVNTSGGKGSNICPIILSNKTQRYLPLLNTWVLTAAASAHLVTITIPWVYLEHFSTSMCSFPLKPAANKLHKQFWKCFWFCTVLIVWPTLKPWPLTGQMKCQWTGTWGKNFFYRLTVLSH